MTFPPGRSIQHPAETTTPDRIRTCGLLLRRQTLYPAELRAHLAMAAAAAARPPDLKLSPFGRGKSMAGLRRGGGVAGAWVAVPYSMFRVPGSRFRFSLSRAMLRPGVGAI